MSQQEGTGGAAQRRTACREEEWAAQGLPRDFIEAVRARHYLALPLNDSAPRESPDGRELANCPMRTSQMRRLCSGLRE